MTKKARDFTRDVAMPAALVGKVTDEQWAELAPAIRYETARLAKELTAGAEKYRPAAERDAELAEFHELAAQRGATLAEMLAKYTEVELDLKRDFPCGVFKACEMVGVNPLDVFAAALVSGDAQA